MSDTRYDLPVLDDETRPWWDALRAEELLIKRCGSCARAYLYPRPFCPTCWSDDVSWERASGNATLYTYSVVHANGLPPFRDRVPYVAAIVELAEGPRLATTVESDGSGPVGADLKIGMPLRVTFRHGDPVSLPVFAPALTAVSAAVPA